MLHSLAHALLSCSTCVALLTRRVDGSHMCTRAHLSAFPDLLWSWRTVVYDARVCVVCRVCAHACGSVEEGAALGMRPCLPPTCNSGRRAVSVPFLACRPLACTNINLIFYLVESTARRGLYSKLIMRVISRGKGVHGGGCSRRSRALVAKITPQRHWIFASPARRSKEQEARG